MVKLQDDLKRVVLLLRFRKQNPTNQYPTYSTIAAIAKFVGLTEN